MAAPLLTRLRPFAASQIFTLTRSLHRPANPTHIRRTLTASLGLSAFALSQSSLQPSSLLLRCDASPAASISSTASREYSQYKKDAEAPVVRKGRLNPKAVKQISAGSICGLVGGLAVSVFSKSLAILIGLAVFGVQALESRGIHIVPYGRLQSIFKNTNVRSAVEDNVAFKLCFGATFALAAFAEF